VREFSTPSTVIVPDDANLTDDLFAKETIDPDRVALSRRVDGSWRDVTNAEFAGEVRAVAKGLIAAGIEPGDRIAIMSKTRYEWTLVDYAIWSAGAIGVPIYETSSSDQVEWIASDAGCAAVVVETADHATTLESVRERLPELRLTWTIDDGAVDALVKAGAALDDAEVERRRSSAGADNLATIIYTSGTTGRPKGCELTHRNLLSEVMAACAGAHELLRDGAATLLFLPAAHVLGRVIQCATLHSGTRLGHTADVSNLLADLQEFQPTFLLAVPRVFEKVYNAAKQRAYASRKGRIFELAERTAVAYSMALDAGAGGRVPARIALSHKVFDRLVYAKLMSALGGRCTAAISGGAPLGERLGHFFRGIGLVVYEGYGLTESTAACTLNLPGAIKIGTVGRPLASMSVRIADDDEIMLRGGVICRGYWHDDAGTAEAIVDGWFHTGDLGALDDDGYLVVTGRKKELIITAGGKNVSPTILEDKLRAHPLISQCMLVGDRRPFIAALITLDTEAVAQWRDGRDASANGTGATDPAVVEQIQAAVDDVNRSVSRAESIRRFRILPDDFTEASGELTPKQSIRRSIVLNRYADEIETIYAEAGRP